MEKKRGKMKFVAEYIWNGEDWVPKQRNPEEVIQTSTESQEDWHDRMHREVVTRPRSDESSEKTLERHRKKLQEWLEKNPVPSEPVDQDELQAMD